MIRKKAIHRSDTQWREILAHQVASGASVKDFCKQNHVTVSGFYAARKRLNVQLTDLPLSDIEQEKPVFVALVEHPLNKSMIMRSKYDLFKIQTGPSWFTKDPLSFY